jgi:hypothetical protein
VVLEGFREGREGRRGRRLRRPVCRFNSSRVEAGEGMLIVIEGERVGVGGELGRGEQGVRSILSAAFMAVCIYMRGVSKPSAFRKTGKHASRAEAPQGQSPQMEQSNRRILKPHIIF